MLYNLSPKCELYPMTIVQIKAHREKYLNILKDAQKFRNAERADDTVLDSLGNKHCAWVLYERQQLMQEINKDLHQADLPPIHEGEMVRLENMAVGHSDYSSKLALYCSERSRGIRRNFYGDQLEGSVSACLVQKSIHT